MTELEDKLSNLDTKWNALKMKPFKKNDELEQTVKMLKEENEG
jgi:hypothetical protein